MIELQRRVRQTKGKKMKIKNIWFTTTKTGTRRAYYYCTFMMRSLPLGAEEAELLIATGQAVEIKGNPSKGLANYVIVRDLRELVGA
jgi:hypothetical protein